MFVERLTKEQLCKFFNTHSISFFMSKSLYEEESHLYASYSTDSMSINMRLYDFEGSTVSNETKWRKFLYEIFGDIYLEEYKNWLDKRNEKMINDIIN